MSNDDPMQAMQTWVQAGQNMFQSFVQAVAAQQSGMAKEVEGTAPPAGVLPGTWMPEASAAAELQREWLERHAELWRSMLGRKAGESVPFSGDKRFEHSAWGESPVFDYLRQAYAVNADYVRRVAESAPVPDGKAKERLHASPLPCEQLRSAPSAMCLSWRAGVDRWKICGHSTKNPWLARWPPAPCPSSVVSGMKRISPLQTSRQTYAPQRPRPRQKPHRRTGWHCCAISPPPYCV